MLGDDRAAPLGATDTGKLPDGYDIRVPETVTLTVPAVAVASYEPVTAAEGAEPNSFVVIPATRRRPPDRRGAGAHPTACRSGALKYYSEEWYAIEPGGAAFALSVESTGALRLQLHEGPALEPSNYRNCYAPGPECGDGSAVDDSDGLIMCRCVRADLEADATKVFNPLGAGGNLPSGARMFDERRGIVYETVAAGYGEATGTSCQAPDDRAPAVGLSRVWLAVRCEVDICGDACAST